MFAPLTDIHKEKSSAPLVMPIQPMVIGFIFKDYTGGYYTEEGQGYAPSRRHAYLFLLDEIEEIIKTRSNENTNPSTWGHKESGHWIAVYANLPAMNCNS